MDTSSPLHKPHYAMPPAKRAILTESVKLFATHGVDAVSVRDIAAASGYSNPALFRHFASKEELARVLFETCYRRLSEVLADAPSGLEGWLRAALMEIASEPEAVHFVLENLRRFWPSLPEDLKDRSLPAAARRMLEGEVAAERLRADLEISLAATVILGTLGQVARAAHFREKHPDPGGMSESLARLLLLGFGPPPSPSRP